MPLSRAKPINDLENRHLQHLKVVKKPALRKCNYKAIMGGKLQLDKVQSQETREHSLTQFWGKSKTILRHPRTGRVLVESTSRKWSRRIDLADWYFRCSSCSRLSFSLAEQNLIPSQN